jgi:hypothetical protein
LCAIKISVFRLNQASVSRMCRTTAAMRRVRRGIFRRVSHVTGRYDRSFIGLILFGLRQMILITALFELVGPAILTSEMAGRTKA